MADPLSAAITIGMMAAQTALTMSRKIEGPRIDDLGVTNGDNGAPRPRVWGLRRLECPIFWADDLNEVERRRKTKGGKFNNYTYFGRWAVLLADHEIEAVRRIWFDTHLVYDLSGTGPVMPFDFGGSASIDDHVTIYLGTETQEPDPVIDVWCSARYGEDSCSAYRGSAYIVFKDIPLEKIGNRIPQVSVEIVGSAADNFPVEANDSFDGGPVSLSFSPDYSVIHVANDDNFIVIDTASRQVIASAVYDPSMGNDADLQGISNEGVIYAATPFVAEGVRSYALNGVGTTLVDTGAYRNTQVIADADGATVWAALRRLGSLVVNGVEYDLADFAADGDDMIVRNIFLDLDDRLWAFGCIFTGSPATEAVFMRLDFSESFRVTGLPSAGDSQMNGAVHYRDATADHFVFEWDGTLYAVDTEGTVLHSYTATDLPPPDFRNIRSGVTTIWAGMREISLVDLSLVRALDPTNWGLASGALNNNFTYDPINHALILFGGDTDGNDVRWYYLDRVGSAGVPLSTIIEDVAELAGIAPAEIDASACTQLIPGYSVGKGSGKDWLDPLLEIHDVDPRPHDFKLQFLPRGNASAFSIASTEFAQAGEDAVLYETPGAGGSDLPALVTMQFADLAAEQQPAVATSGPLGEVDSQRQLKLELGTLALDTDEARQLVARWHRRQWFERQSYGLALSMQQIALEPGDVGTLVLPDSREVPARVTSLVLGADRTVVSEWRPDDPSVASLDGSTGATFDGRDEQTIAVPVLSRGFVLDIPLLSDADEAAVPQVHALAAPYADGPWSGAVIYQATDGEYSDELTAVASSSPATWGYVAEAMRAANPNLWDRGTELTVTLQTGELTGCTEAAANADPSLNLAAIGADERWEIVQFTNASLVTGKTYTVSGFKRGRRGTEWAGELHAAGDSFVLLDTAEAQAMGLSEVGTAVNFKAVTAGRSNGFPFGYEFTGASLKPYAPAHLKAEKEANGDWTISWVRRTRVGGAWTSGTIIPLSEASEEYELDLSDGVTTVTKAGLSSASYTWTVATQTSDTGAEVMEGDLEVAAYQISAAVDRGFAAELTA